MNLLQRLALWLAVRVGLLPKLTQNDVAAATVAVLASDRLHKDESAEYRRHLAYKGLTDMGMRGRTAALAIEIAVSVKD